MNVILGALISALITFVSAVVALFVADTGLEFANINTATWVILGGGGVVSFMKGTQSLTVRRLIDKVTDSGDGGI